MAGEKTEKATPKRKQDERKKGNIFKSVELVTVFSLLVIFYSIKLLGPFIVGQLEDTIRTYFSMAATTQTLVDSDALSIALSVMRFFAFTALPLLLISGLVAIVITMAQTKMLFSAEAMSFKMNRLNPLQGLKKMFSMRGLVELVKALIKVSVMGYIVYSRFVAYIPEFTRLIDMSPEQALSVVGEFVLSLATTAGIIFLFLAVGDYAYQWWDYEKNLRMSKQEIKEEYKQTEGDPQIKGKIRERQRRQAMSRMMQDVPKADVVIRNPTHYAVAIAYDPDKNTAPLVLAKGADLVALRIVEIAEQNNIATVENKPLARGLYENVEIDREVPEQFYQPVAEVLAFVYSLRKKEMN